MIQRAFVEILESRTLLSGTTCVAAPLALLSQPAIIHPAVHRVVDFAPDSVRGLTVHCTIRSGFFPLASSGSFDIQFSKRGGRFQTIFTSGQVFSSNGTFNYTKTGVNGAVIVLTDTQLGVESGSVVFTSAHSGTYRGSTADGGYQRGSFSF